MKSTRLPVFLLVGAVFVAIGVVVGLTARVFPVQASAEAVAKDSLFNFMLAIAVVVFLIVEGGIIYSIIRFRRPKGDEGDGAPFHGNTALEVTWTAIPAVIVFVLSIYSYQVFVSTQFAGNDDMPVGVMGAQFKWAFNYEMPPDPDPEITQETRDKIKGYMVSDVLVLPVNRRIRADIQSQDVIHAFYIPEFRIKQDATPGRVSNAFFTPTQTGEWWVICAELCGVGHADMSRINRVRVVEQADYDKFVADLYARAKETALDPRSVDAGRQLIQTKYPCSQCHTISELGFVGNIGPSLNGLGTRAEGHAQAGEGLVGGTDAAAYIRGSIVNPDLYVVPGYNPGLMPQNYGNPNVMPEDDREAIINYLLTLK